MVRAMLVLHNFLKEKEGLEPECVEDSGGLLDISVRLGAGIHTQGAATIREKITVFCSYEGQACRTEQHSLYREVNHLV